MYDYKSPITVFQKQIETQIEGEILKAVCKTGVVVDKDELLKALKYDREQYEKGYQDGLDTNGWIPCSEQSEPKENGTYLVSGRWLTSGNIKVGEAEYFGEWNVANNFIIEAWQQLPEPYKRGTFND